jgi:hypothetical protein
VVFERSDVSFGSIASVGVWRSELVVHVDAGRELLEGGGCFIIGFFELWFDSALGEENMGSFEEGEFQGQFSLHWFCCRKWNATE